MKTKHTGKPILDALINASESFADDGRTQTMNVPKYTNAKALPGALLRQDLELRIQAEEGRREHIEAEWPSIEEQEAYWSLRDEGRSDQHGESYAERQT